MLDIILGVILFIAMWIDIKKGIIPNWLNFSLILFGLIINLYLTGWTGLLFGMKGFLLGLAIFLLPFALGGLGAGDVKLVSAVGALKGAKFIFIDSVIIAIVGGIISLFILLKNKKIGKFFYKLLYRLPLKDLSQKSKSDSFAYGVAIAVGTWITLWLRW
ncbi:A24 family peptidase [Selenihalanaerobacter shriftii]|uniref:Prepilin peptidase CpaA n=1 Tax=Selenihalanaerobacter shriftii TaxID=142842 RepID=A0A1T4KQH9_9FIRM|nr:A24 family peptidase [Selenihalanaerobacter shriftii]SJZ44676.1 prepilin peptidase CpaA [Selenihalanaerobacter shriftii]